MNITDAFISRINSIAAAKLTQEELHQVSRCLLDYIGVTYAGRRFLGAKLCEIENIGTDGDCSIVATSKKKDLITAAMMNGIAAHVIELDD